MKVFDNDSYYLGTCTVTADRVMGLYFTVPIAIEGPWCEACKCRHTQYETLIFVAAFYNESEIALIARSLEEAKNLPGFKQARGRQNLKAQRMKRPTTNRFSHC